MEAHLTDPSDWVIISDKKKKKAILFTYFDTREISWKFWRFIYGSAIKEDN